METGPLTRRLAATLVLAASTIPVGSLRGGDHPAGSSPPAQPPGATRRRPVSLDPRHPLFRPEFDPAAVARGEADEPKIAEMRDDWSQGLELRATVDRTEFRQLQRIRVVTRATNVTDRLRFSAVGVNFLEDRYLGIRVRVFDAKGKLVPMTEYYKHEGRERTFHVGGGLGGSGTGKDFRPGRTSRTDVIANLIYDMTRPGEYWILIEEECGQQDPPPPRGEDFFYARAKPIKVRVAPDLAAFVILPDGSSIADPDRP